MIKQKKCDSAEEYKCPYENKKCRSRWSYLGSESLSYLTDSNYFYTIAKRLNKTTKIWFVQKPENEIRMHICEPVTAKKDKTLYDIEKNKLVRTLKKEFLTQTNNLKNTIKNIEKKLK